MAMLALVVLFLLLENSFQDDREKCGHNEEYSQCVNPCNNCEIKGRCNFLVCNEGCDCIEGYHRDDNGRCISKRKCPNEVYLGDLPIENPDLFGGDMLGIEDDWDRSAIVGENRLWPKGVVPYTIDKGMTFESTFLGAFSYYRRSTCIRFVPRTNEVDYIRIFPGEGCYSHVGRTGGQQPVSIGTGCHWMGTVIHELGHAIGFYHEQNRSDRDDFLIIYWDNIKEGLTDQFFKLTPQQNLLLTDFDYDSIMLYGEYTFSKQKGVLKTMVAKKSDKPLREVVAKYNLSQMDIKRINMLYKCGRT